MIDYQTRYQNLFAAVKEYLDADDAVGVLQTTRRAKIDAKIDAVRRRREALLILDEMINPTDPEKAEW